jgi:hypothetical protein
MNIKSFLFLSKIFNKILNDKNSNIITYAINFLHLVKPHNDYLIKHEFYLSKKIFTRIEIIFFFISLLKWVYRLIENYFYFFLYKKKNLYSNSKVILISHIREKNHKFNKTNDYVYGKIPHYLELLYKKGNLQIIYINHSSLLSKKFNCKDKNMLVLDNILFLSGEIKILFWQFKEAINVFVNYFLKKKINLYLYLHIFFSIFSNTTKKNLRLYYQFKKIVKNKNYLMAISTLEGFAWEKLFFYEIRKNNVNTKILGYQFTGILQNQVSLKKIKNNIYSPDFILTCGFRNKKILEKSNQYFKKKIFNLGSNRNILFNVLRKKNNNTPTCLVLPEGTEKETSILFSYAINVARISRNIIFILRTHPLIDIKKIKHNLKKNNYLPSNIIFSNKSFAYDLSLSNLALYRGSTSIITALSKNLVPIYYKYFSDTLNIDPIYDYKDDKFIVKDVDDFLNVLNKFNNLKNKINLNKLSYSKSFYTPQNKSTVINFFNKITNQ